MASTSEPRSSQISAASSTAVTTHSKCTTSSSNRLAHRNDSTSSRRGPSVWSASPRRASWTAVESQPVGSTSLPGSVRHRSVSRSTPSRVGFWQSAAPLREPTEQPTTRSGTMPRSSRARSIPTCTAPRFPPPPMTKAVVTVRVAGRSVNPRSRAAGATDASPEPRPARSGHRRGPRSTSPAVPTASCSVARAP